MDLTFGIEEEFFVVSEETQEIEQLAHDSFIARAKELGWLPLVRMEDGLERTIEYIKANKLLLSEL